MVRLTIKCDDETLFYEEITKTSRPIVLPPLDISAGNHFVISVAGDSFSLYITDGYFNP